MPADDGPVLAGRLVDVAVSTAAAVALAPLMLIVAAAIKLDSRGPVLYRQVRVGEAAQRATTQPHAEGRAWQRFGFDDPMELLGDKATLNPGERSTRRPQRRLPPTARTPNISAVVIRHRNSGSEIASDSTGPLPGMHWNSSADQTPTARPTSRCIATAEPL